MKYLAAILIFGCEYKNIDSTGKITQIDKSKITVFMDTLEISGNESSITIDDSLTSWFTSPTLVVNDHYFLAYNFGSKQSVSTIEIFDNYTNQYAIGDADYYTSDDSTNGIDGVWVKVTSTDYVNNNFNVGSMTVTINKTTLWLKIIMNYKGTGGYGISPNFYMSEINFYK